VNHSIELLASNKQHSSRDVRPVYSIVKDTVRLVDLNTKKVEYFTLFTVEPLQVSAEIKLVENLMYFCHLRLVLLSPGPLKM